MNIGQPTNICFFQNNQTVGRNKAFLVFGILSRKCDILLLISGAFLGRPREKPLGIFVVVLMANATRQDVGCLFCILNKNLTWQRLKKAICMKKSTKHHQHLTCCMPWVMPKQPVTSVFSTYKQRRQSRLSCMAESKQGKAARFSIHDTDSK